MEKIKKICWGCHKLEVFTCYLSEDFAGIDSHSPLEIKKGMQIIIDI